MNPSSCNGNYANGQHLSTAGRDSNTYVYRDWSQSPPNTSDMESIRREQLMHPVGKKLPTKLNAMLSRKALSGMIEWLPHGRSWRIINRERFTHEALPPYFAHTNFNSFVRIVNAWGFRRVPSGADMDSYYHELFIRGLPHLHARMRRLSLDERKVPVESQDRCPNFHEMPLLGITGVPSISATQQNITLPMTNPMNPDNAILHSGFASRHDMNPILSSRNLGSSIHGHASQFHQYLNSYQDTPRISHSISGNTQQHNMPIGSAATPASMSNLLIRHQQTQYNIPQFVLQGLRDREVGRVANRPSLPMYSEQSISSGSAISPAASEDPLISILTNMLLPRVQLYGPPRTNAELVGLLINEWNAPMLQATTRGREAYLELFPRTHLTNNDDMPINAALNTRFSSQSTPLRLRQYRSDGSMQLTESSTDRSSSQHLAASSSRASDATQQPCATEIQHVINFSPASGESKEGGEW